MTRESIVWERELKEAGWKPLAAHPNSPMWLAPDGQLFPGPGYAHSVMLEQKKLKGQTMKKTKRTSLVTKEEALQLTTKFLRQQHTPSDVAVALLVLYARIAGWKI